MPSQNRPAGWSSALPKWSGLPPEPRSWVWPRSRSSAWTCCCRRCPPGGALRTRRICRPRPALSFSQRADGDCPDPSGRAQAKWKASGRRERPRMKRAAQRDPGNRDSAPIIILLIAADRAEEWKRLLDEGAAFKEVGPPKWQRRKSI